VNLKTNISSTVQGPAKWFAYSGKTIDATDWQLLQQHLSAVAELTATRSQIFGASDAGYLTGLLHDLGKYSQAFQQRLLCESRWKGAK
jgi:hypothetical protein